MSDQQPPPASPAPAIQLVQQASNVSWERNSSLLAKNQFAFTSAAPVTFQFKTATKADFEAAKQQHATDGTTTPTTTAPVPVLPVPASASGPQPTIQPPTAPPPTAPPVAAPIPIGNFTGSVQWAAYHNPTTARPYFYCHTLKITTPDCPADITAEFNPAYEQFLANLKPTPTPPPSATLTPAVRPPPGFTRTTTLHNIPLPTTSEVQPTPNVPTPGPPKPPVFTPRPPSLPALTPSQSRDPGLAVHIGDDDANDSDSYSCSQASQVTVNHITTPVNRGPSFSFANDISNPTKLPYFQPKRGSGIAEGGEDLPDQHPLVSVLQSSAPPSIPLPHHDNSSRTITPQATPTNRQSVSTHQHHNIGFSSMKSPSHGSQAIPLLDKSVPFSELFKVDALPTQKDGTFLKLTTGFRKSWRPRYIILHQGAFRWWDDITACTKQMNSPNAIVSIVGCSAQLPPIGSQIHPKNGLYIDGNVGSIQEILERIDSPQEFEQASFFIRTDHLGEIDSWLHVMYRNGVIDARYTLNPDLNAKTLEQVTASTHHLFEVWSRERVNAGPTSFQVTASGPHNKSGIIPPTPRNGNEDSTNTAPTPACPDRSSSTQIFINPADLIAAAHEIATPRSNAAKGMYVPGGLYDHQPVPTPVQINGKKRSSGAYYAVLFADRIECYETYEDASLVCRYSNPDLNNTINPEHLSKPKLAHLIPITRESTMALERTSYTSTSNETTLKLAVKENKLRNIKKQEWQITFEECNPATGHIQVITGPNFDGSSYAQTPGSSLSNAQKWFTVIEYCLNGPLAGTFGSSLWWSVTRSTIPLPLVLHNCFRFISLKGLQEEGILRVPGNNEHIKRLRLLYDASQTDIITDPNTAAGLFKLFLRENKDRLIPRTFYKAFTSLGCRNAGANASVEKRQPLVAQLKTLVDQLPPLNQVCLAYVIHTLTKIAANANVNKMFAQNCAMVLAPNLFRAPIPEPAGGLLVLDEQDPNLYASAHQMAETLAEQQSIILILIEHFTEIFPRGSPFP